MKRDTGGEMEQDSKLLKQMIAGLRQEADKNTGTDTYNHDTPFSLYNILEEAAQSSQE